MHKSLVDLFPISINKLEQKPRLTQSITYLISKTDDTTSTHKIIDQIICLSTTYKIITLILIERMYQFHETDNVIPEMKRVQKRLLQLSRSVADEQYVAEKLMFKK